MVDLGHGGNWPGTEATLSLGHLLGMCPHTGTASRGSCQVSPPGYWMKTFFQQCVNPATPPGAARRAHGGSQIPGRRGQQRGRSGSEVLAQPHPPRAEGHPVPLALLVSGLEKPHSDRGQEGHRGQETRSQSRGGVPGEPLSQELLMGRCPLLSGPMESHSLPERAQRTSLPPISHLSSLTQCLLWCHLWFTGAGADTGHTQVHRARATRPGGGLRARSSVGCGESVEHLTLMGCRWTAGSFQEELEVSWG